MHFYLGEPRWCKQMSSRKTWEDTCFPNKKERQNWHRPPSSSVPLSLLNANRWVAFSFLGSPENFQLLNLSGFFLCEKEKLSLFKLILISGRGRPSLRCPSMISTSWYSNPSVIFSSWEWVCFSRTKYVKSDGMSLLRLGYIWLWLSYEVLFLALVIAYSKGNQLSCGELLFGEAHVAKTRGVSGQKPTGTEATQQSCEWAQK